MDVRASSTMRTRLWVLQAVRRFFQAVGVRTVPSRARTSSAIRATQPAVLAARICWAIWVGVVVFMMKGGLPFARGRTKSRTEL